MKLKDLLAQSTVDTPIVRCWEEDVLLPTYETGEFEKIRFSLKNGFTKAVAVSYIPTLSLKNRRSTDSEKLARHFYRKPIHQSHDHARTRRSDSNGFR